MCSRAPTLGLSFSMEHQRRPSKMAGSLFPESLVMLEVEVTQSGSQQGRKLRLVGDTLQPQCVHLGYDKPEEAMLGLQTLPGQCPITKTRWWPASVEALWLLILCSFFYLNHSEPIFLSVHRFSFPFQSIYI